MPKLSFTKQVAEAYVPLVKNISIYKESNFLKLYNDCIDIILDFSGDSLKELKNRIYMRSCNKKFSDLMVDLLFGQACKSNKNTLLELRQRIEGGFYIACKKSRLGRDTIGNAKRVSTTVRIDPDLKQKAIEANINISQVLNQALADKLAKLTLGRSKRSE